MRRISELKSRKAEAKIDVDVVEVNFELSLSRDQTAGHRFAQIHIHSQIDA